MIMMSHVKTRAGLWRLVSILLEAWINGDTSKRKFRNCVLIALMNLNESCKSILALTCVDL